MSEPSIQDATNYLSTIASLSSSEVENLNTLMERKIVLPSKVLGAEVDVLKDFIQQNERPGRAFHRCHLTTLNNLCFSSPSSHRFQRPIGFDSRNDAKSGRIHAKSGRIHAKSSSSAANY